MWLDGISVEIFNNPIRIKRGCAFIQEFLVMADAAGTGCVPGQYWKGLALGLFG
jgi:hypothetical protein